MEFSTTKVIARPLPKYVTEAKQKFVFGDDDHEMMEATETKINPFSFPISRRYFSFPTSASIGKRQDYVVFTQKNKFTNSRKNFSRIFSLEVLDVSHCLKITQNVAFEFLNVPPFFVLLKLTCLVTLFDRKL